MKCEACGYKFLFASSTECPSCGDLREAIVKESDIQAAMDALRADTVSVVGPWKEPDDGVFVWGNASSNAHTEPQDEPKRPFDLVAGVVAGSSSKAECATGELEAQMPPCSTRPFSATVAARFAVDAEFRQACRDEGLDLAPGPQVESIYATGVMTPVPIMDSIVGLKAANAHLVRQLAAQALAHAEQMEAKDRRIAANEERLAELDTETTRLARFVEVLHRQMNFIRTDRDYAQNHAMVLQDELSAMRVTPATTKLRCCDNGHTPFVWENTEDICPKCGAVGPFILKPVNAWMNKLVTAPATTPPPERRPDGTLKPAAKAWEAPRQASDPRRIGS